MAPTPDRTTIKASVDGFATLLRANLVADPPTVTKPLRRVVVGESRFEEYPRPFLTLAVTRFQPVGLIDNDKIMRATVALRLVTDVTDSEPHGAVLDIIGALDDYLDGIIDTGVIDGAEGFDDRDWSLEYPRTSSGARVVAASAALGFVAKVERGQNRIPAS